MKITNSTTWIAISKNSSYTMQHHKKSSPNFGEDFFKCKAEENSKEKMGMQKGVKSVNTERKVSKREDSAKNAEINPSFHLVTGAFFVSL